MAISATLSIDQAMDRVARGREATIAGSIVRPLIEQRIELTLYRLCREYREKQASHDSILGGIAEISALRSLIDDLERIHKQGIAAKEQVRA